MKVKITQVSEGIHPSEVVVSVNTINGTENLVIAKRSIRDDGIDIGFPIRQENDSYLIELPRETLSGYWRVWVKSEEVYTERLSA